jgi:oligopeptidase B
MMIHLILIVTASLLWMDRTLVVRQHKSVGFLLFGGVDAFTPVPLSPVPGHHHAHRSRRLVVVVGSKKSPPLLPKDKNTHRRIALSPPEAERDEDFVVVLGKGSSLLLADDDSSLTVQVGKQDPEDKWLDPPVSVPDPYGWMRVREDEYDDASRLDEIRRVLDHIDQENRYTEAFFQGRAFDDYDDYDDYDDDGDDDDGSGPSSRERLQQQLVEEYTSLHDAETEDDDQGELSQLYYSDGFYYYTKRVPGQAYPLHCRVKAASFSADAAQSTTIISQRDDEEEIILNENEIAKVLRNDDSNNEYFAMHTVVPIPIVMKGDNENSSILAGIAFSVDTTGDESYTLYLQDFSSSSQHHIEDHKLPSLYKVAMNTSGTFGYVPRSSAENLMMSYSLHYVRLDPEMQRPFEWVEWQSDNGSYIVRHTDLDDRYWGDLRQTSDGKFILWTSASSSAVGEMFALDLASPPQSKAAAAPALIQVSFTRFLLDHRRGHWWILNLDASASHQLYTSSDVDASILTPVNWTVPRETDLHKDICLDHLVTYADHVVVQGRQEGLQRIWVLELNGDNQVLGAHLLLNDSSDENEPARYVAVAKKQQFNSKICLLTYESMVTPRQILQVNLTDQTLSTLYEQPIPGYSKADFCCRRIEVPSRDGKTCIPVSLVYRKGVSFPCPLHLLGYGAYGHSLEPSFSTMRLPLLNRGVVCAVAHVRGGGELGPRWHASGSRVFKQNSIDDFCDVANWLVDHNWTEPDCLAAEGRSAGGLLVASAMNQNPGLFRSVVLGVPFLDIMCTMADSTLPLTALEWDEWGDPHTQQGFDSIRAYAPMHNIVSKRFYPSCLMVGGWKDPRVPYWEPLKFAAALRHSITPSDERPILVKIDTQAGHSFGSNRTKYFEELAWIYTFVLDQILPANNGE